jgi:hypothetical protein
MVSALIEYRPINDRIIVAHLRAFPVNINVVQAYSPTMDGKKNY